jgi:putative DNA primase/helicase
MMPQSLPPLPPLPPRSRVSHALAYGFAVFQIFEMLPSGKCSCGRKQCNRGKHPRPKHGLNDATTDAKRIRAWWRARPNANIGIALPEGVIAVDIDPRNGGDRTLAALEAEHGPLPATRTQDTGGGGEHRLFRISVAAKQLRGKLGMGIEIKKLGGYIIAEPSNHESGGAYRWRDWSAPIADAPAWLIEMLTAPKPRKARNASAGTSARTDGAASAYGAAALDAEVAAVRRALNGTRNIQLNTSSFNLGQLVAGGEIDRALVEEKLADAARAAELEEGEIGDTIASGIGGGMKEPRNARSRRDPLTDLGNAERFAREHRAHLRWDLTRGQWFAFDGKGWSANEEFAHACAKQTVRNLFTDADKIGDDDTRRKAIGHALKSEAAARINAMLDLARHEPGMSIKAGEWDSDEELLNVANGTIDLRTGKLREHRAADLITRLAPVVFDARATCPTWDRFLAEVLPDPEVRQFVARAVGYSLTASIEEQCFLFLWGNGQNGKSVALEVLRLLFGTYARNADASTFLARASERISNDLAALAGARLVTVAETENGRRLAESLIKTVTGGEPLTARFLHREYFEFHPRFKLWLASNYKPQVRGTDEGIWRRIRLIPFTEYIAPERRDPKLAAKLKAELPGILNWALAGLRAWRASGLGTCQGVAAATNEYREQMDPLADFFADACVLDPKLKTPTAELYSAYARWSGDHSVAPLALAQFVGLLPSHGLVSARIGNARTRGWAGVGLKSAMAAEAAEGMQ